MLRFSAGLLFFLFSCLTTSQAMAGPIGTVVATQGAASSSGSGGSRTLVAGSPVFEHDKIIVGSGNAQIQLLDGTKLVVGSGSALVLERFLMRGGGTAQSVSVDALRGTFRFITGQSPKNAYNIHTSNATIGIRGTGFDFWVGDRTVLALLKGNVRLCGRSKGRSCIDLQPNCSVGVAGGGNPARKVIGTEKASLIGRRLPYLKNQSGLRSQFQLNTSSCARELQVMPKNHLQKPFQPVAEPPPNPPPPPEPPPQPPPPPPKDKCSSNCGNGYGNGGPGNGTGNEGNGKGNGNGNGKGKN